MDTFYFPWGRGAFDQLELPYDLACGRLCGPERGNLNNYLQKLQMPWVIHG